jgi:hypothetical protein
VVSTEDLTELGPRHLVPVVKSGSEVSPPSTSEPTKLLGHVQSLLELDTVQESKLGLGDAKLVIHLKQIEHLCEHRRVHHQEVSIREV